MRRILCAAFVALLPSLVTAAPPRRSDLPANTKSMVHIDVEAIQKKRIGRELIDQVLALPSVKKQLKALPEALGFLKKVQFRDLTVLNFPAEEGESAIVVLARLNYEQARTLELLQSARDYAKVSYQDVEVHQWRANMDALGDMLLDRQRTDEEKEEDKFEPVFAAVPDASTVIVSTSLKQLTAVLDRRLDRTPMIDASRFKKWTRLENCLVYVAFDQEEDGFPSNVIAQLCAAKDERITIAVESIARTEEEQQVAKMMANVINNFDQYKDFVRGLLPKQDETADEDEKETDASADGERTGSLKFSVSVDGGPEEDSDSKDSDSKDWIAEVGKLISRTATASFEAGVLRLHAEAYPNKWNVELKSEGKQDAFNVELKLFSSKEKYLAAEKNATIRR